MLAFSNDYYGFIFRATQSVELFCAYDFSVMLTNVYSTALSLVAQNKSIKEIHQILNEEFDFEWWKNSYCQKNECKYRYPQFYI